MEKEYFNTKEAPRKDEVRSTTEAARESVVPGTITDAPTAEDIAEYTPATPSAMDEAVAGTLTPRDAEIITALVPKPKRDYAVAGAGMYADIAGNTPAVLSEEGKRKIEGAITRLTNKTEARNILFAITEKGEIYNTLTAYEKAFIIALRVLLSDSTADRHAIIEAKRKEKGKGDTGGAEAYEGIDFFGACKIRPEAYDIFLSKEKSAYYSTPEFRPTEKEAALLRAGFTPSDIIVVIDKNTFIRDYLGGKKGGKQSQAFAKALDRLRTGRVALTSTSVKAKSITTINLIKNTVAFYGIKNGQKVEYYAISLHPVFAEIYKGGYITYPANNAEVLSAILSVRGGADGLLTLYDTLLRRARYNFEKISARPEVQVFTLKEEEALSLTYEEKEIRAHKKQALARFYGDTGINIFYTVGLLADRVKPPTEAERKQAIAAGKDVEVEIHFRRVAATNCTR